MVLKILKAVTSICKLTSPLLFIFVVITLGGTVSVLTQHILKHDELAISYYLK